MSYVCDCGENFEKQQKYAAHKKHCDYKENLSEKQYLELDKDERYNILFKKVKDGTDEGEVGLATGEVISAVGDDSWRGGGEAYSQLYNDLTASDRIWSEKIVVDRSVDKEKKKWFATELNEEYEKLRVIRKWIVQLSKNNDLDGELKGKFENLAFIIESIIDWDIDEERNWKIDPDKIGDDSW